MISIEDHARQYCATKNHQSPCGRGAGFADGLCCLRAVQTRYVHMGVGRMIVESGFLEHWKFQLLVRRTEDPASPLMVLRLWGHCQRTKNSQLRVGPEELCCICHWDKNPEDLISLLISLRFLDQRDGFFQVHGFDEHNGRLVSNWNNGSKGGRPRKPKNPNENGFPVRKPKVDLGKPTPSIYLSNSSNLSKGRGTEAEVLAYGETIGISKKDAQGFFDSMEAGGWTRAGKPLKDWKAHFRNYQRFGWLGDHGTGGNGQRTMSAFEIGKRQAAITEEINKIFKQNGNKRVEGDGIDELKARRLDLQHQLTT